MWGGGGRRGDHQRELDGTIMKEHLHKHAGWGKKKASPKNSRKKTNVRVLMS